MMELALKCSNSLYSPFEAAYEPLPKLVNKSEYEQGGPTPQVSDVSQAAIL